MKQSTLKFKPPKMGSIAEFTPSDRKVSHRNSEWHFKLYSWPWQVEAGKRKCRGSKYSLTLRMDTLQVHGSNSPVLWLATILQWNLNSCSHRTQWFLMSHLQVGLACISTNATFSELKKTIFHSNAGLSSHSLHIHTFGWKLGNYQAMKF